MTTSSSIKGPQFAFNTNRSPYLLADYYIDVLGAKDTAQLKFTIEGFSLGTSVSFKTRKIALSCGLGVARKYSVLTEIIDILTQTCQPFIHDEDPAKNAL